MHDIINWGFNNDKLTEIEKIDKFYNLLNEDIKNLSKSGKRIYLTFDHPFLNYDAKDCIPISSIRKKANHCNINPVSNEPYIKMISNYFNNNDNIKIFSYTDSLYEDGKFRWVDSEGVSFFRDRHISYRGSDQVANSLFILIKK